MLTSDYEKALEECYETIVFPENWSAALDRLARSVGATGAMFYPKDVNENATLVPSSRVYGELLEDYVEGGWFDNHYRAVRGWPLFEKGGRNVILEHDLATDDERKRLPHYNELYLKWGFPAFAAVGFMVDGDPWCVPLIRTERHGGFFTREEANQLALLPPHLSRMMKLATHFERSRNSSSLETFDQSGKAAMLLDRYGRISTMNSHAERLLRANLEYIRVRSGRLHACRHQDDRHLQTLIASSTDWRISPADITNVMNVYIPRLGKSPIGIEAISPPGVIRAISSIGHAILLLSDLDQRERPDHHKFVQALALTPSEALMCACLLEGSSIKQAADRLQITQGTARQYVKSAMQKTGVHRQSELLLLLARL